MDTIERLGSGVVRIEEMLAQEPLWPDPKRTDWSAARPLFDALSKTWTEAVEPHVDAAFEEAGEELAATIGDRLARLLVRRAVLARLIDESERRFRLLLTEAQRFATSTSLLVEISAGAHEPSVLASLTYARCLLRREERRHAIRVAREVLAQTSNEALRDGAHEVISAPIPITTAPTLFTLNGCGARLYGARDHWSDGSYVTTYYLTAIFVPVFPLCAYRVWSEGNQYRFAWKQSLRPFERTWQLAAAVLVVLGLAGLGVQSYLGSATHVASVATDEAARIEARGDRTGALAEYRRVVDEHGPKTDVSRAASAFVRLSAEAVTSPCVTSSIESAERLAAAALGLPEAARRGEPAAIATKRLSACAAEIGDLTPASRKASLRILDRVVALADSGRAIELSAKRDQLRLAIAGETAADRPLVALSLFAAVAHRPEGQAGVRQMVARLGEGPSPWAFVSEDLAAIAGSLSSEVPPRLAAARAAVAKDLVTIESGDEKTIAAAHAAAPTHQELAAARGAELREAGDARGCLDVLSLASKSGPLVPDAEIVLGECVADSGDLTKGAAILSLVVEERLPALEAATRALDEAADAAFEKLALAAQTGTLPSDVQTRLTSLPGDEQAAAFREWALESLRLDPELAVLRTARERQSRVVGAAMFLGSIRLSQASVARGEARGQLLRDAEQVFLSIHHQAEGAPSFHLQLGEVYHRLGKTQEGDVELERILVRKDPELTMAVMTSYRELGLEGRAREIGEALYASVDAAKKPLVALRLTLVVHELEDLTLWLDRSDATSPIVRAQKLRVAGELALRESRLADAQARFSEEIALREKESSDDTATLNNVALAYQSRFKATGDPADLGKAAARLEKANRVAQDDSIVLGNRVAVLRHAAMASVLESFVRTRALIPDDSEAEAMVGVLLRGPRRAELTKALATSPGMRRALDLAHREQVLAPQKASAYEPDIAALSWQDDTAGMAALRERIEALGDLTDKAALREHKKWLAGERDETAQKHASDALRAAEATLARAEATKHAPTIALATWQLARVQMAKASMVGDAALLRTSIETLRAAGALWPDLADDATIAHSLAALALAEARRADSALDDVWKQDHRAYASTMILLRALSGDRSAAILASLRARSEWREMAEILRAARLTRPDQYDWALAHLAGEEAAESRARAVFDRSIVSDRLRIRAKLSPLDADNAAWMGVVGAKGQLTAL